MTKESLRGIAVAEESSERIAEAEESNGQIEEADESEAANLDAQQQEQNLSLEPEVRNIFFFSFYSRHILISLS